MIPSTIVPTYGAGTIFFAFPEVRQKVQSPYGVFNTFYHIEGER